MVIVLIAAALQTTMFARLRPFDSAPALVLLVVIAFARHIPAEAALILGFGAGVLQDLLADSPLGLWALVFTSAAYFVLRFRDRLEDDFSLIGPFVFAVTAGSLALFSVLGTIFGEKTLADVGIIKKVLLPSLYNMLLAALILPFATWVLGAARRRTTPFEL
ncbi:MAG: rod shape-determining protein MreD [Actinobacteria bacterium RBG_16_68_21]|nr:MAG: rod shape-determining protein MreD [Actinobacteria bacterium RBG_16_68_21]